MKINKVKLHNFSSYEGKVVSKTTHFIVLKFF